MGSFTNRDILDFATKLGLSTAKGLAKAGVKTVMDNVDAIHDEVVDTVDNLREKVTREVRFVELCLLVKPGFGDLVDKGMEPLKAFKRAVRETGLKSSKNSKGGNQ